MSYDLLAWILVPVWAVLFWKELRPPGRRLRAFRIVALTLVLLSLAMLLAQPVYRRRVQLAARLAATPAESIKTGGLFAVGWSAHLKTGSPLIVQGSYHNIESAPVTLLLTAFDQHLDSVTVPAARLQDFTLKTLPSFLGRATYELETKVQGQLSLLGRIPVEVSVGQKLQVLILNSAPSFENKYLRDWLANNRYGVSMRTEVSTARFHTDFSNMGEVPLNTLSSRLLEKFDLVIADAPALGLLSRGELSAMKSAVEVRGMGLLIQLDSSSNGHPLLPGMGNAGIKAGMPADTLDMIRLADGSVSGEKLALSSLILPAEKGRQPLIRNSHGQVLVNLARRGRGLVSTSTLDRTYSWLLQGHKTDYTQLWAELIGAIVKPAPVSEKWAVRTLFPKPDGEVSLELITGASGVPLALAGETPVYLRQNEDLPNVWTGKYWPAHSGWHSVSSQGHLPFWFYVYSDHDWSGPRKQLADEAALAQAEGQHVQNGRSGQSGRDWHSGSLVEARQAEQQVPVPPALFYALFILSITLLWVEKKF